MNWTVPMLLGLVILIPVGIGMGRYLSISNRFYPFIYYIWLGGLVEVLNDVLITNGVNNTTISTNIYVLLSSLMMIWFFYRMDSVIKFEKYFYFILVAFICLWVFETFIFRTINEIGSYYRILFSLVIVLISISSLNYLLTSYSGNLVGNPIFLVCVGTILYYTIKILVETFWLYGSNSSHEFRIQLYRIMPYVDIVTNLIFSFAILWIPKKQLYIQQF
jgi:hypothetical protein